jgi:y4mF family transcriptional regulator
MIEETSARLLRELQERNKLLDATDAYRTFKKYTEVGDLQKQMESVNASNKLLAKITEYSRAVDIAKQLSGSAPVAIQSLSPPSPVSANSLVRTVADLAPLIRKARKTMKLNQTEFAAHAGVGRRFVSELESGKSSLEFDKVMACIAAAGIDITAKVRKA